MPSEAGYIQSLACMVGRHTGDGPSYVDRSIGKSHTESLKIEQSAFCFDLHTAKDAAGQPVQISDNQPLRPVSLFSGHWAAFGAKLGEACRLLRTPGGILQSICPKSTRRSATSFSSRFNRYTSGCGGCRAASRTSRVANEASL